MVMRAVPRPRLCADVLSGNWPGLDGRRRSRRRFDRRLRLSLDAGRDGGIGQRNRRRVWNDEARDRHFVLGVCGLRFSERSGGRGSRGRSGLGLLLNHWLNLQNGKRGRFGNEAGRRRLQVPQRDGGEFFVGRAQQRSGAKAENQHGCREGHYDRQKPEPGKHDAIVSCLENAKYGAETLS